MPHWRVFLTWLIIMAAETLHGILRRLFLLPLVGDLRARQIGVFIGSVIIILIALSTVRWMGRRSAAGWLAVGALWTLLTLSFEVVLGRATGATWDRIASDYDPSRGGFMLAGVAVLLAAPWLAARSRGLLA